MVYFSLREYMRSESEKSFNECQIRKARLKSLGLAYLSPQNKSLAQSFRYMRTKPTIIAFKTPSLENCGQQQSCSSFGSVGKITKPMLSQDIRTINYAIGRQPSTISFMFNPERQMEEGRIQFSPDMLSPKPENYPVGKPLEVTA